MNDEQINKYKEDEIDAKQGFPRYRERIANMTFKKKVIEYLSVNNERNNEQKQSIIFDSFSISEKNKFFEKYSRQIQTIVLTYNRIVHEVRTMNAFREPLEANLREVYVHERNVEWLNKLIKNVGTRLSGKENDEDLLYILKEVKTYKSPVVALKTTVNVETGLYELDTSGFNGRITSDIQVIETCMKNIKAFFMSLRSFLDEQKIKDLFPSYAKDLELYVEGFNVINDCFSSKKGNIIRRKSKWTRSKFESSLLERIEDNERRGYAFPDYTTVQPVESFMNESFKIYSQIKEDDNDTK